jgi:hypothetical protein
MYLKLNRPFYVIYEWNGVSRVFVLILRFMIDNSLRLKVTFLEFVKEHSPSRNSLRHYAFYLVPDPPSS